MLFFLRGSSAQILLLVLVFVTYLIFHTAGAYMIETQYVIGMISRILFVPPAVLSGYDWFFPLNVLFPYVAGVFSGLNLSFDTIRLISSIVAFIGVGCVAGIIGFLYTLIHLLLLRVCYGKIVQGRGTTYVLSTLLLHTGLSVHFYIIAYLRSADVVTYQDRFVTYTIFVFFPTIFFVWWVQHLFNQHACGFPQKRNSA